MSGFSTPMSHAPTKPSPPRIVAASCYGVSKSFALVDAGSVWRAAFSNSSKLERFQALSDITFDVPKGEFVGILGRNGAGKSTLLRVVGGVYPPDAGRLSVRGSLSGLYELGLVGNAELTGRQYADRLLTIHGFDARQRAEMVADIHDFSELQDRFDDPVQTYSAGMSARLFFAAATAGQYEVYLLDEILSVGDQHFQAKCWRRLRERVSKGASGILVTHDWSAVIKLCSSAHVIDRGKIIFSGPSERAARIYLFGEEASAQYRTDIARFGPPPVSPMRIASGDDLTVSIEVSVFEAYEVRAAMIIERMRAGYGWEVIGMPRRSVTVATGPGRYHVDFKVQDTPFEAGTYQISLQLMTPNKEAPGQFVLLDSYGWLSGNGLVLEVAGDASCGARLPAHWSIAVA